MPMFHSLNDYHSMAQSKIKQIYQLKNQHMRRVEICTQISFLKQCIKSHVIPKGFRIKHKLRTKKSTKASSDLERLLVKERLNQLYFQKGKLIKEIDKLTSLLVWDIHPEDWIKIREYILFCENKYFLTSMDRLKAKFEIIAPKQMNSVVVNLEQDVIKNTFINNSEYKPTKLEEQVLNKGPRFIKTNNIVSKLEVATDSEMSIYLNQLEHQSIPEVINKTINSNIVNTPNLTKEEYKAMKDLKNNPNICIVKSDKGNTFVLLNKNEYDLKLETIIESNDYSKLNSNPSKNIDLKLRKIIGNISKAKKKEGNLFNNLVCHYNRDPSIFGNPKIHKEGFPLRPIISGFNTVLSKASKFITKILVKIFDDLEGDNLDVKNISEAKQKIISSESEINSDFVLFSLDVVKMFNNIDPMKAFNIISEIIESDKKKFSTYTILPAKSFLDILKLILTNSYFIYKDKFYIQNFGLPMGSSTSPIIAKIYMHHLEKAWTKINNFNKIKGLVRYMDDYLGKWTGSKEEILNLIEDINNTDDTIKVTLELEQNNSINFLDANIIREGHNIIFSLANKEWCANTYLPNDAFHDPVIKKSLIQSEAIRIGSFSDKLEEDYCKLTSRLLENGYKMKQISKGIDKGKLHLSNKSRGIQKPPKDDPKARLTTTYMGKTTRKIRKKLKRHNISVSSRKPVNLEGYFASTFKYNTDNGKGIIYRIYCECGESYIGESAFDFDKRKSEHSRDLRLNIDSNALTIHRNDTNHKIDLKNFEILGRESQELRRKFKESLFIQKLKPSINVRKGMQLKGTWDF